jgi:hypothetical protein
MNAWTDGLLRQLARFAGLEFGDGDASLAVEWRNFPTGGVGLLVVLGLFLAVALILACYRREAEHLGAGRRRLLVSARLVAVGLAVLLLFEPRIVRTSDEEHAGHVLVLLDVSQSMAQRDPWLDPLVAGPWQELGVADPTAVDRRALMERLRRRVRRDRRSGRRARRPRGGVRRRRSSAGDLDPRARKGRSPSTSRRRAHAPISATRCAPGSAASTDRSPASWSSATGGTTPAPMRPRSRRCSRTGMSGAPCSRSSAIRRRASSHGS